MNHENDDPLNLEALHPDEHAKRHGFLSNWIMAQARATVKESTKLARAESLRTPESRAKARLRMLGKQIALGKKHTVKQRQARSSRMCGNKRALGARYKHTEEQNIIWAKIRLGVKRGPYKKKLTISSNSATIGV
jgi:ribosomal protein L17